MSHRAFSVIELLVVVAVLGVLAIMTVPAFNSLVGDARLAQGGDRMVSFLNLARQTALARNLPVEVRFYRYAASGEESSSYRAFQAFLIDEEGKASPITRMETLPEGVVFSSSSQLSSLLGTDRTKTWSAIDPQPVLPQANHYECRAFLFRPNGDAGLPSSKKWYLTMHKSSAADDLSQPPDNFFTIQLDPQGGAASIYRP